MKTFKTPHANLNFTMTWRPLTESEFKAYARDMYCWEVVANTEPFEDKASYIEQEYQAHIANWETSADVSALEIRLDGRFIQYLIIREDGLCGYINFEGQFVECESPVDIAYLRKDV
jgi:hypothetical protein